MITCKDCLRALNQYVDRELSEDDVIQVRVHLVECGSCEHMFKFEESLRRLVMVRCQEQVAPESLRERISLRLTQERSKRGS